MVDYRDSEIWQRLIRDGMRGSVGADTQQNTMGKRNAALLPKLVWVNTSMRRAAERRTSAAPLIIVVSN